MRICKFEIKGYLLPSGFFEAVSYGEAVAFGAAGIVAACVAAWYEEAGVAAGIEGAAKEACSLVSIRYILGDTRLNNLYLIFKQIKYIWFDLNLLVKGIDSLPRTQIF